MKLSVPKGVSAVSVGGTEYKVKKGVVEVPDTPAAALIEGHGCVPVDIDPDAVVDPGQGGGEGGGEVQPAETTPAAQA